MSNPHYASDLEALDGIWDLARVMGARTIIIVTGSSPEAELVDRPVAEMLRDRIDQLGQAAMKTPEARGIVVSDTAWLRDKRVQANSLVSIAAPNANDVTRLLGTASGVLNRARDDQVRVALYGHGLLARDTRDAVLDFMRESDGLAAFLAAAWSPQG